MIGRIALWIAVTFCAAWAVLRLLGLERGYPLVGLLAFTPYAAVLSVVIVAVAAVTRRRAAIAVSLLAAVVLVSAIVPRALGGPTDASGPALRIVSVNLHLGKASPAEVIALARSADVLALQELDEAAIRRLEAAGLRDVLPNRVVRYGYKMRGTALYARMPLRALPAPTGMWAAHALARARVFGVPVELMSVHPAAPFTRRRTRAWSEDFGKLPRATPDGLVRILVGDFNATLDHAELRELIGTGYRDAADQLGAGLHPTFPVGQRIPPITLDHVLADRRVGIRSLETQRVARSDHRALRVSLVLPS